MSAPADMNLAPSPSAEPPYAPCEADVDPSLKFLLVPFLVMAGVAALFLLHVLGTLRRRSSHKLLHAVVLGVHTLSYTLVSYTLGLIQDNKYTFNELPVWAVCLLMLLGGTDNLMVCNLNDVDNWKSFHMKHLFKGGLVLYIVTVYGLLVPRYQVPLLLIIVVNFAQSYARIKSMRMASKSQLLRKNLKPIADYMKVEDSGQPIDLPDMKGYRYVVAGEHTLEDYLRQRHLEGVPKDGKLDGSMKLFTTVEQIWECKGSLLESKMGSRLKDLCLSMALSKMLNRRFAGLELAEAGLQKTNDFVFKGLLADDDKQHERPFRVIEVELGIVYDLYYTRYPYLYHKGRYLALCLPLVMVILCLWLTYELFYQLFNQDSDIIDITSLGLTLVLMAVVTFLEAFQLYLHRTMMCCCRSSPKKHILPELSEEDNMAIHRASSVACDLSQYCAYLVAFVPDLLPDHCFESAAMLDNAIKEARKVDSLRDAKTVETKCEKLISIGHYNDDDARIVVVGAWLARQLMKKDVPGMVLQWKVLSDFWAEMMLYVAPCDDAHARDHLEALARGGEFITHLWALLTHAGVLERGAAESMAAV